MDASDTIAQFVTYLEEEEILTTNSLIPTIVLYEIYKQWSKEENVSAKIMASKQFLTRLEPRLNKKGFFYKEKNHKKIRTTVASLLYKQCNFVQIEALTGKKKADFKKSYVFENKHLELDDAELERGHEIEMDLDHLSAHEKRTLVSLCFDKQDVKIRGLLENWTDLY